jgi:hypothetical protein
MFVLKTLNTIFCKNNIVRLEIRIDMKIKILAFGIVLLFFTTIFASTVNAGFFTDRNKKALLSSSSTPKISGILLRSYIIGNATGGKKVGRIAFVDFAKVEFKTFRFLPPIYGYVNYENVSVIIFGLKSDIPEGSFHLDTKASKDKVSSFIFK